MKLAYSEQYSDWSEDESDGIPADGIAMDESGLGDQYDGSHGFPSGSPDPDLFIADPYVLDFRNNTAVEGYPDFDDDGVAVGYDADPGSGSFSPCEDGFDAPEDLDPRDPTDGGTGSGLRTLGDDTVVEDANGDFAEPAPLVSISDVKPGDFGEITFQFYICDNPGYVWLTADSISAAENGVTEPEADDPDESGDPNQEMTDVTDPQAADPDGDLELLDEIQVRVWYDEPNGDNLYEFGGGDEPTALGPTSLRDALTRLAGESPGVPLDGDPSTAGRDCYRPYDPENDEFGFGLVALSWWLPADHANEIQSDSVEFDFGFYTEQCRHNDGSGMNDEGVSGPLVINDQTTNEA